MIPLLLLALSAPVRAIAPPPATPAPKALSACMAVPRADVEPALGRTVTPPEEDNSPGSSTCDYTSGRARVTVTLSRVPARIDLPAEIVALQREIEGSSARLAPAFGPRAFFLDLPGAGTQLHVFRGADYLMVSVLGFGEPAAVAPSAERMARAALGRL